MASLAGFTLIMAVNTAFVASGELIERIAHRYEGDGVLLKFAGDAMLAYFHRKKMANMPGVRSASGSACCKP